MEEQTQRIFSAVQTSAASLAYLGDAIWEVQVRLYLVRKGSPHPSEDSLRFVTASAQSDAVERLLPELTEEEQDIYRRGRNSVHGNVPKRATVAQYRRATGLEALFGYLALCEREDRIRELTEKAFGGMEAEL